MGYTADNKKAWEEAYVNRKAGWGEDIASRITEGHLFLDGFLLDELNNFNFAEKDIAQFCCNNGRELLSAFTLGARSGTGFDIAENMVAAANEAAAEMKANCAFYAADIAEITGYENAFDLILVTTGAIGWFDDLAAFFRTVSSCLKTGGSVIVSEMHPVTGMLPAEGDPGYDGTAQNRLMHSYFKREPWVETGGMRYMSDPAKEYKETSYSFSHTFAEIITAVAENGMRIGKLKEYDRDLSGLFSGLDRCGIPLSYILTAKKTGET